MRRTSAQASHLPNLAGLAPTSPTFLIWQAADGTIVHGRNLDYGLREYMLPITLAVQWTRGGEVRDSRLTEVTSHHAGGAVDTWRRGALTHTFKRTHAI